MFELMVCGLCVCQLGVSDKSLQIGGLKHGNSFLIVLKNRFKIMVHGFFLVQKSSLVVEYRALVASFSYTDNKTREVAQWLKVLAAKYDDVSSFPKTY